MPSLLQRNLLLRAAQYYRNTSPAQAFAIDSDVRVAWFKSRYRFSHSCPLSASPNIPVSVLKKCCMLSPHWNFQQIRHKYEPRKSARSKSTNEDATDEDDIDERMHDEQTLQTLADDEDLLPGQRKDWQSLILLLNSARIDLLFREVLKLPRAKIEEAFYDKRIIRNGERLDRKGETAEENDEIDLIIGLHDNNPERLEVSRIIVKKFGDAVNSQGKSQVFVRVWKKLVIPNFAGKERYGGGVPEAASSTAASDAAAAASAKSTSVSTKTTSSQAAATQQQSKGKTR